MPIDRPLRAVLPPVLAAALAFAALVGCGEDRYGDDGFVPRGSASGASGNAGELRLRDAVLGDPGADAEFPGYDAGEDAPLLVTIANSGDIDDELVSVTTDRTDQVTVEGATTIPANGSVSSIPDADNPLPAPSSAVPSRPVGDPIDGAELRIVLRDIDSEIPPGIPTDVTFGFREAGEVTLRVPVCTPSCSTTP